MGRQLWVFLLAGLVLGCGGPSEPDDDPHDYTVEAVTFACGIWSPSPPPRERALLDIHFGRRTAEDPMDTPRAESVAEVRALGGTIVHTFHLPAVRAVLAVDVVPELSANFVSGVEDADEFSVRVVVMIETPLSERDRASLESVGAREIQEYPFYISAVVPDSSLLTIRRFKSVEGVEDHGVVCAEDSLANKPLQQTGRRSAEAGNGFHPTRPPRS